MSYFNLGRYAEALKSFKASLPGYTEKFSVYRWIGNTNFNLGNYDEAIRNIRTAIRLQDKSKTADIYNAYNFLINVNILNGNYTRARTLIDSLSNISDYANYKANVPYYLAMIAAGEGNYEEVYSLLGRKNTLGMQFMNKGNGLLVNAVFRGTPAAAAGLENGDLITEINNISLINISNEKFLNEVLANLIFASRYNLKYNRDGQIHNTEIIMGMPPNFAALSNGKFSPDIYSAKNKPVNMALLDLDGINIPQNYIPTLTNRLRSELFKTGRYNMLERGKMNEILDEQGFQMTGCTASECIIEAG
jgi:tetratricopeptide (TPR) repeat protein